MDRIISSASVSNMKPRTRLSSRSQASLNDSCDMGSLSTHGVLELEAAAALLMLRYQYDRNAYAAACAGMPRTPPPSPPPPEPEEVPTSTASADDVASTSAAAADRNDAEKNTPKDQVRTGSGATIPQPLKKRTIPPHLLQRTLTPSPLPSPAIITPPVINNGGVIKPKIKNQCNKALLKSCRNMIREFLENRELQI